MSDRDAAFEAYFAARSDAMRGTAYLLCGDWHRAEDLVQQTFLRVAVRWPRLAAGGDPDPYVRKVLYHEHISRWRRARRVAPLAADDIGASVPDAADQVAVTVAVRQALTKLGARQRAALILRYFEDLTEAQTAQVLGCRIGTVKSQVRDGLARLRVLAPELATLMEVSS